jgi:hypothetical protein
MKMGVKRDVVYWVTGVAAIAIVAILLSLLVNYVKADSQDSLRETGGQTQSYGEVLLGIRDMAPLTSDFATSLSFDIRRTNQLMLYITYVQGSSDSMQMVLEFSHDQVTWYTDDMIEATDGVVVEYMNIYRFDTGGDIRVPKPVCDRYFRLQVRAVGDPTGAQCSVTAYYRRK